MTGLVLEGGAMRGLFTAGALDVLMENGVTFDGMIGVSAGAAFGCNFKSGQIGRVLRYNLRYCRDPEYCGLRSLIRTGDLFGAEFCYRKLPNELDPFDNEAFNQNPMLFWIVCTDVETGRPVYHRCDRAGDDCSDWIRASSSMPLASRVVEKDGGKYLVIHSGSRNLGTQVAEFYRQIAVDLNVGKEEYFKQREEIIRTYKEQGRRTEIQATIKALEKEFKAKEPTLPRDLCFLYGSFMEDYLHDVDICQRFAERNRAKMTEIILERCGWTAVETFQTIHNYIDVNEMILRKGAVSAKAGEKLLIPINMRDGSLICIGKGNEDWNFSAPHGAGRLMSRSAAFERLTMADYEREMKGIYTTCVVPDTLDESPMAYKNMDEIIENIEPTAEIVKRIKPIYNFKAAD